MVFNFKKGLDRLVCAISTARNGTDCGALNLFRRLAEENGFSWWPVDTPELWDLSADPEFLPGVEWQDESRTVLKSLNLSQASLGGRLDLSGLAGLERLYISENHFSEIFLDGNTRLRELKACGNQLGVINPAQAPGLNELDLTSNLLEHLDLSQNPYLVTACLGDNQLMHLNLIGAVELKRLVADTNRLSELDLRDCPELIHLTLYENHLTGLDLSRNFKLDTLNIGDNNLSTLDLSQNPLLAYLNVYNTGLRELDLRQNPKLWYLVASSNYLTNLDLSAQTALIHLVLSGNSISALEVGANRDLRTLDAGDNNLETLDVSRNQNLWYLYASLNRLKSLDVSDNRHLLVLDVTQNFLRELNVGHSPKLQRLFASSNRLTHLDISRNPQLERLFANQNPLSSIEFGPVRQRALREVDLSECRLPLSVLIKCVGRGADLTLLGPQNKVFFEYKVFKPQEPAVLDFSSEAVLEGSSTLFTVLDVKRRPVGPETAETAGGIIKFHKKGRYQVLMENPLISSTAPGHSETVRAFSGWIDVLNNS